MQDKQNLEIGQLVCNHSDCKKKISAPLEIFNGQLLCPHCREPLGNDRFIPDEDSNSLLEMCQSCYGDYLQTAVDARVAGSDNSKRKRLRKKGDILLANARDFCRAAYRLGNPLAQIQLGEFWERGYMDKKGSKAYRYKMAEQYYKQVINGQYEGYDSKEEIVEKARKCLDRVQSLKHESMGSSTIQSTFDSIGKIDGPVFGYHILTSAEIKNLCVGEEGKASMLQNFINTNKKSIEMYCARIDDTALFRKVDKYLVETFAVLDTEEADSNEEFAIPGKTFCLWYFNKSADLSMQQKKLFGGKGRYNNYFKVMLKEKNNIDGIVSLAILDKERGNTERGFTPNDVFFIKYLRGPNPIVALTEYIREREQ